MFCKTDSFVVKSNVHFPTNYHLLWDCARKSLDMVGKFLEKYPELQVWSFDNGFWHKDKKAFLETCIVKVVMPEWLKIWAYFLNCERKWLKSGLRAKFLSSK